MPLAPTAHQPVMLAEILAALAPADGEVYVDGTFGGGGYSCPLLEAADCQVWGLDRDPDAVSRARGLAERYGGRLTVVQGRFSQMESILARLGVGAVDGVALDLGLSSDQLADPERGFSFRLDGPLDMRMEKKGATAADFVNRADAEALSDVIRRYGEDRHARRIARAIVAARAEQPITRSLQLARRCRVRGSGSAKPPASGDPDLPGAAHTYQRRTRRGRRISAGPARGRTAARAQWADCRCVLPLARGPAREAVPKRAHGQHRLAQPAPAARYGQPPAALLSPAVPRYP